MPMPESGFLAGARSRAFSNISGKSPHVLTVRKGSASRRPQPQRAHPLAAHPRKAAVEGMDHDLLRSGSNFEAFDGGGGERAGMSDASKVGAPPGRGRSDSLADKTDRFGEQCGWLRDPECGQPKGKR
jgi:hypothetical protein